MRRHVVGAEVQGGATHFRVWAPAARSVTLVVDGGEHAMQPARDGYFEVSAPAAPGARYGFKLDDAREVLPDPASRFQPDGPHGVSQVVDPSGFAWKHDRWAAAPMERQVFYEMHIGTFTREGTWRAAMPHLARLSEIGVTTLEVMPVAEFPGGFGWGYDGVQWFAPYHGYGTPDDFRTFVDAAHGAGLAVILDVVYNHFGPDGNYLPRFAPSFHSKKHDNEWGDAINYDSDGSSGVRAFVIANARYWIDEFRLDGFRLDAVQQIFDDSTEHIVAALAREAREAAAGRPILVIAEHEPQHALLARHPRDGGWGLDGIWNDDFHHAAVVALTGTRAAYYSDYCGEAREFVACARHGFLFQGQHYRWQKNPRGRPALDLPALRTVCCLENHDQVANSATGSRLHQRSSPGAFRAMTALLLLGPWMPMLFQGQEFGSTRPFVYFADHAKELSEAVEKGRREFMMQFRNVGDPELELHAPHDRRAFERSVLDDSEREAHDTHLAIHRDLLALRRDDRVIGAADRVTDGAAIDAKRFVLRFSAGGFHRLLVVNLDSGLDLSSVSEPLVAPPDARGWQVLWHSERPEYDGGGMPPLEPLRWEIPGQSAVLLGEA